MDYKARVENAVERHLKGREEPEEFARALRHALFPGGARARPTLCMAIAHACGDDRPALTDGFSAAIEYLHCASLVHDDLPCFDDAPIRRGKPSVHAAFGEATAVLVGDGLIVLAFQTLADVAGTAGERLGPLLSILAESAGAPHGLVAGQAMEMEPAYQLSRYHAAKTGALFEAATAGGAAAAGGDIARWRQVGVKLGAAYQTADDIHDRIATTPSLGKPIGQDERLARPNSVDAHGLDGALTVLKRQIEDTIDAVPDLAETRFLRTLIEAQTKRFVPAAHSAR